MGRPRGWASEQTGRPVMRSPGRPPVARREDRQRYWAAIARGLSSEAGGSRRVYRLRLAAGGFGRVAACHLSLRSRCRAVICRSRSVK